MLSLLDQVAAGQEVEITKRGRTVARARAGHRASCPEGEPDWCRHDRGGGGGSLHDRHDLGPALSTVILDSHVVHWLSCGGAPRQVGQRSLSLSLWERARVRAFPPTPVESGQSRLPPHTESLGWRTAGRALREMRDTWPGSGLPGRPRLEVLPAIGFDGEPVGWAVEVEHVRAKLMLAPELGAVHLSAPEEHPQSTLSLRRLSPEAAHASEALNAPASIPIVHGRALTPPLSKGRGRPGATLNY